MASIHKAIGNVQNGWSVDHVRRGTKVVAFRFHDNHFRLAMTDGYQTTEKVSTTERDAALVARIFFNS